MSNALALTNDYDLPSLFQLAGALSKAHGFIPQHLKSEGEIVAVILAGRELGLPPMASMRSISLIRGKVILDASMQLALMVRAGAKVRWLKDGTDGQEAVLEITRDGNEPHLSKYTLDMAKQANLLSNDTWKKHTAAMLRARAVSAAGKAYMPDVLSGCYVPGEIDDDASTANVQQVAANDVQQPYTIKRLPLPADAQRAIDIAAAQGFVVSPVDGLINVDLPNCATKEALVAWMREVLALGDIGANDKRAAWGAFSQQCAECELVPAELLALAKVPL